MSDDEVKDIINQLKSLKRNSQSFIEEDEPESIWTQDVDALDKAISLLGKHISKRLERVTKTAGFRCPTCGCVHAIFEEMTDGGYCNNCGQKLVWRDEK